MGKSRVILITGYNISNHFFHMYFGNTKVATVFISSTKSDLIEYRQAAIEICNRLGLIPLAMEYFEAEGRDGTEGSKRQLEKADVYVGVFAYRYGPVTEEEFDYAGERGLERLCFIVDKNYPWPPGLIDFARQDKLQKFLEEKVSKRVIRDTFTTKDNFSLLLFQSLSSWMDRNSVPRPLDANPQPLQPERATPGRPDLLIGREEDAKKIKARFGIDSGKKLGMTIIRGWPGVGKTSLINSLVYDEEVKSHFKDGILWAVLGENGNAFSELTSWGRQLGIYDLSNVATLEEAITRLKVALREKNMLLIVDDLWDSSQGNPFKQIKGENSHLLFSTRFPGVANELAEIIERDVYLLGVLDDDRAFELFQQLTPKVAAKYPNEARKLVHDIEGLPLAIRVAGRLLASENEAGIDVYPIMQEISDNYEDVVLKQPAPADRFDPKIGTTPTINYLLERSTNRLNEATRECFAILGAFAPKPATFDFPAMKYMWEKSDDRETLATIRLLVDQGLLEFIPSINRYQMHAVLVMHAQSMLEDDEEDDQSN
jgi:hypothetical protein